MPLLRSPWSRRPRCGRGCSERGFRKLGFWTRGVDTGLFNPDHPAKLDLPRPIFMTMGRVAVEKNIEAFLSLDLPGTKVVVGDGPQKAALQRKYPRAVFLGEKKAQDLTSHLAAADVFVFPSLTDTFGVVQLEALACGTPVAAFPVTGPKDVVADHPIGALDADLRTPACARSRCRVKRAGILRCRVPGKTRAAVSRQSHGVAPEPFAAAGPPRRQAQHRARLTTHTGRQTNHGRIVKLDDSRPLDFDREMVEQAYDRWAPVYDLVFGAVQQGPQGGDCGHQQDRRPRARGRRRHRHLVAAICAKSRIFGTDISEAMLRRPGSASRSSA